MNTETSPQEELITGIPEALKPAAEAAGSLAAASSVEITEVPGVSESVAVRVDRTPVSVEMPADPGRVPGYDGPVIRV